MEVTRQSSIAEGLQYSKSIASQLSQFQPSAVLMFNVMCVRYSYPNACKRDGALLFETPRTCRCRGIKALSETTPSLGVDEFCMGGRNRNVRDFTWILTQLMQIPASSLTRSDQVGNLLHVHTRAQKMRRQTFSWLVIQCCISLGVV